MLHAGARTGASLGEVPPTDLLVAVAWWGDAVVGVGDAASDHAARGEQLVGVLDRLLILLDLLERAHRRNRAVCVRNCGAVGRRERILYFIWATSNFKKCPG